MICDGDAAAAGDDDDGDDDDDDDDDDDMEKWLCGMDKIDVG